MAAVEPARRGGRPSREDSERLRQTILDVATGMFLTQGYGATSIDAIARQARISKRTFYHRFPDKAALFGAVVHEVIARIYPARSGGDPFHGAELEAVLLRFAQMALTAVLSPLAIALQRVILSEAPRFPELAAAAMGEGSRAAAVARIAALLERERQAGRITLDKPEFAAEQFLAMVVSLPSRRAMGFGPPMTAADLDAWAKDTVTLFLHGCRAKGV